MTDTEKAKTKRDDIQVKPHVFYPVRAAQSVYIIIGGLGLIWFLPALWIVIVDEPWAVGRFVSGYCALTVFLWWFFPVFVCRELNISATEIRFQFFNNELSVQWEQMRQLEFRTVRGIQTWAVYYDDSDNPSGESGLMVLPWGVPVGFKLLRWIKGKSDLEHFETTPVGKAMYRYAPWLLDQAAAQAAAQEAGSQVGYLIEGETAPVDVFEFWPMEALSAMCYAGNRVALLAFLVLWVGSNNTPGLLLLLTVLMIALWGFSELTDTSRVIISSAGIRFAPCDGVVQLFLWERIQQLDFYSSSGVQYWRVRYETDATPYTNRQKLIYSRTIPYGLEPMRWLDGKSDMEHFQSTEIGEAFRYYASWLFEEDGEKRKGVGDGIH